MNDSRLTSPRQNQGEKGGMRQVASGEVLETCLVFLSLHPKDKSNSRNILVLGLNIHVAGSFCLVASFEAAQRSVSHHLSPVTWQQLPGPAAGLSSDFYLCE